MHPAALPNGLTQQQLRLQPDARGRLAVDPARAGWRYLSFRALTLERATDEALDPEQEHVVVVIHGADVRLVSGAGQLAGAASLAGAAVQAIAMGRPSPFVSLPAALYIPPGCGGSLRLLDGAGDARSLVAIASAPPSGRTGTAQQPIVINRDDIRVEARGAGNAARQVNHIVAPDFPADRLEVVEVLTPSGNWSSWPPHKHDVDAPPDEAVLEEIYFYQFGRPTAWGIQRLYRPDRGRDCMWEVHSGEVILVTDGYHPFAAAHGDDAYYLNALAGDRRTMACSFDPDYDWVRDTWPNLPPDARIPLVR